MAVDRPVGDGKARPVQPVDDRIAREKPRRHRREGAQYAEFGGGQRHVHPLPQHRPPLDIDIQPAVAYQAMAGDDRGLGRGPSQDGLHPRHYFARAERFDDIVVGAQLDADHPVDLLVAAGKEQDRRVALAAQAAAHLQPVHARHGDVEDDEVGVVRRNLRQRRLSVARLDRRHACFSQREGEQLPDVRVVIDDQDGARHGGHDHCTLPSVNGGGGAAAV